MPENTDVKPRTPPSDPDERDEIKQDPRDIRPERFGTPAEELRDEPGQRLGV